MGTQEEAKPVLTAIEFYSGVGGQHRALKRAFGNRVCVTHAFDMNKIANIVYATSFPEGPVPSPRCIKSVAKSNWLEGRADIWLMSPPCQPYTRAGRRGDLRDARAESFMALMERLSQMKSRPTYIHLENVKGFDGSDSHQIMVDTMHSCGYTLEEFLLCPTQLGIPNERLRYYCIATLSTLESRPQYTDTISREFPPHSRDMSAAFVADYLEPLAKTGTFHCDPARLSKLHR